MSEEEPKEPEEEPKSPVEENNKEDKPSSVTKKDESTLRGIVIGLGIAFAVIFIFSFGLIVGQMKANFPYHRGQNHGTRFGVPPRMAPGGAKGLFRDRGAAGTVIKKTKKTIVVRYPDNAEKIIKISDDTQIIEGREEIKLRDVKIDDRIAVTGQPDDEGRIEANLIRVFKDGQDFTKRKGMK